MHGPDFATPQRLSRHELPQQHAQPEGDVWVLAASQAAGMSAQPRVLGDRLSRLRVPRDAAAQARPGQPLRGGRSADSAERHRSDARRQLLALSWRGLEPGGNAGSDALAGAHLERHPEPAAAGRSARAAEAAASQVLLAHAVTTRFVYKRAKFAGFIAPLYTNARCLADAGDRHHRTDAVDRELRVAQQSRLV